MKKLNIRERIYNELKNEIIYGKIAPGQALLESDLAEKFECSRAPIREALQQLKSERYLNSGIKKTATVPRISLKNFEEIFDVRIVLECYALEKSSVNFKKSDLDHIIQLQQKMKKSNLDDKYITYLENNQGFHLTFAKISNNETLYEYINDLINRVNIYHPYIRAFGNMEQWIDEHEEVIKALENFDFNSASLHLKKHLEAAKIVYLKIIKRLPGM